MTVGICARCKKKRGCRFRQPGAWVSECEIFAPEAKRRCRGELAHRIECSDSLVIRSARGAPRRPDEKGETHA